jgi:hypothetical protein
VRGQRWVLPEVSLRSGEGVLSEVWSAEGPPAVAGSVRYRSGDEGIVVGEHFGIVYIGRIVYIGQDTRSIMCMGQGKGTV